VKRRAASIAILFALILPSVGHAGLLRCDSHRIAAQDFEQAKAVARRAAGTSKLVKQLPGICMNPGRGRLWFEAEPEPQPDGSVIRRHFVCTRDIGPWSCEALQTRLAQFDVIRDGSTHRVEFELPPELAMTDGRQIVTRAFERAPSVLDSQECLREKNSNLPAILTKKAFAPSDFDPTTEDGWREILPQDNGDMAVVVDGNALVFSRAPDGTWNFSCWYVLIVVT
jgi:hypothetical protein